MRRLFLLSTVAIIIGACANNELQSILSEVSSVIDDDPARAMSLLESVSLDDCRGEKQRAEYALLKSKALDKNYIDVTDDSLSGVDILTVNWYDDYSFLGKWSIPSASSSSSPTKFESSPSTEGLGTRYTAGTHGLLTGTYEKVLGETTGNQYLWSVLYYDDKGREVQRSGLTLRGGYARTNTGYTFSGNPSVVRTVHYDPDNGYMAEKYSYSYDSWDRPLGDEYRRTALTSSLPSTFTYSETKTLHSRTYDRSGRLVTDARLSSTPLTTRYDYDIRGHLTSMLVGGNENLGTLGETFTETIRYNALRSGATNPALWAGQASSVSWMTGDDGIMRNYDYRYDNLGRLTQASYSDDDPNPLALKMFDGSFTYDLNGNLITAIRPGNQHTHEFTMDGNRPTVHNLVDVGSILHPKHTILSTVTYEYDTNGNLTADGDNVRMISYNILNLPETVTKGTSAFNSPKTKYLYRASGEKLRSTDHAGRTGTVTGVTDYAGNLIFEDGVLKTVLIDGGFIDLGSTSTYYYFISDHLGNNRMVVDAGGVAHQVTHYGPYGETLGITTSVIGTQTTSPYKFSGKEWDSDATSYAFGARHYSPSVPFWTSVDPLAEKSYSISPYAYCAGDPVNLVDPEGLYFTDNSYYYVHLIQSFAISQINYWQTQQRIVENQLMNLDGSDIEAYASLSTRLFKIKSFISEYQDSLTELAKMEDSNQGYNIIISDQYNDPSNSSLTRGGSKYNENTDLFDMVVPTIHIGLIAHELKHGYQFEIGELSNILSLRLYDIEDEYEAYQRQFLFSGEWFSRDEINSMEQYDKVPTRLVVNPINDFSLIKAIEAAIESNSAFRYKGVTYNKHSVIK